MTTGFPIISWRPTGERSGDADRSNRRPSRRVADLKSCRRLCHTSGMPTSKTARRRLEMDRPASSPTCAPSRPIQLPRKLPLKWVGLTRIVFGNPVCGLRFRQRAPGWPRVAGRVWGRLMRCCGRRSGGSHHRRLNRVRRALRASVFGWRAIGQPVAPGVVHDVGRTPPAEIPQGARCSRV